MPFRPINEPADLPKPGMRREDLNCDFKSSVDKSTQTELAKDVAAFANASGGTLLIGANEGEGGALRDWVPMTEAAANALKRRFDDAVREQCLPLPVFDPKVIQREPGQFTLAVNVWPFPSLPVHVRVKSTEQTEGKAWDAWVVFVRVGTGTKLFTPEQAAMLMIPAVRNAAMLLDSIDSNRRKNIVCYFRMPQMEPESAKTRKVSLEFKETRLLQNVAIFFAHDQVGGHQKIGIGTLHVPLNEVDSVWSLESGDWCLKLKGQIHGIDNKPVYVPNG